MLIQLVVIISLMTFPAIILCDSYKARNKATWVLQVIFLIVAILLITTLCNEGANNWILIPYVFLYLTAWGFKIYNKKLNCSESELNYPKHLTVFLQDNGRIICVILAIVSAAFVYALVNRYQIYTDKYTEQQKLLDRWTGKTARLK